jgi:hypothetical protein
MIIADLIKQIVEKIKEEKEKPEMEECDTCGQISRLKCGLCEWSQRKYASNK